MTLGVKVKSLDLAKGPSFLAPGSQGMLVPGWGCHQHLGGSWIACRRLPGVLAGFPSVNKNIFYLGANLDIC